MNGYKTEEVLGNLGESLGLEIKVSPLGDFVVCRFCVCVFRIDKTGEIDRYTHPEGCGDNCDCHKLPDTT